MKLRSLAVACVVVCSICLVAMFGFVPASIAQDAQTGALSGTVSDPSGGVVAGATVTLTSLSTGQARTTTSDSSGLYRFNLLVPGDYKVTFSAKGFQTIEVPSVSVHVTETTVLNQPLQIGSQTISVTVESTAETI